MTASTPSPTAPAIPGCASTPTSTPPDPDALAAEFTARGCPFSAPLADNDDGLRGFEVTDPDGHALFFGWPR